MELRGNRKNIEGWKRYSEYHPEMLDVYFREENSVREEYLYDKYVSEYISEFGSNVHIVLFEELIKNPKEIINAIYGFLGLDSKYEFDNIPKDNEGDFIYATREGWEAAAKWIKLVYKTKFNPTLQLTDSEKEEVKRSYLAKEKAPKLKSVKMLDEQKKYLEEYYGDSVRRLEKILEKDLSHIWF